MPTVKKCPRVVLGGVLRVLRVLVSSLTCLDGVASRNPEISSCRRDLLDQASSHGVHRTTVLYLIRTGVIRGDPRRG